MDHLLQSHTVCQNVREVWVARLRNLSGIHGHQCVAFADDQCMIKDNMDVKYRGIWLVATRELSSCRISEVTQAVCFQGAILSNSKTSGSPQRDLQTLGCAEALLVTEGGAKKLQEAELP